MSNAAHARDESSLVSVLGRAWKRQAHRSSWRAPTPKERRILRDAMGYLVGSAHRSCTAASLKEAQSRLAPIHLNVSEVEQSGVRIRLVQERAGYARGAGMFAVRCGSARPWVIQAPHTRWEKGTRLIAAQLFVQSNARAVFWNTHARYGADAAEKATDLVHPADVAHQHGSLFQAATVGAMAGDPALRVLQLHGADFSSLPFDAIISFGTKAERADRLRDALRPALGRVAAYGVDAEVLGGTTNVQGRAVRRLGRRRFLHVEMSMALRRRMQRDVRRRAMLVAALTEHWK